MIDINSFEEMERTQSHTFINFSQGVPYTILGWSSYKNFNNKMNNILLEVKGEFDIDVYLQEYEDINIADNFYWIYSFSVNEKDILVNVNSFIKNKINDVMNCFFVKEDDELYSFNNHDENFKERMHPFLANYYCHMVFTYDTYIKPTHPPREKSYSKDTFDISKVSAVMKLSEFKKIINDYMNATNHSEHHEYMYADDGFFSSKYEGNKTLREECLPILKYVKYKNIPEDLYIQLGVKKDNFDAKIFNDKCTIILEITSAVPDHDHHYLSIRKSVTFDGYFPVKNMHDLKKEFDMFPEKIVKAINSKHEKEYGDERTLMVNMPMEYTYQNEGYIIGEILKEVKEKVIRGKGGFFEILLNDKKIMKLF
ncbi:hypothetical protein [Dickeya dianthicola]|uniref:hypothetical protein n=1 Tax=Dickeya dianthicola TaxID=204039 RepID=UPI00136CB926|nr:hypothetical protein [Dickeya dianthicola]MCI4236525.1 hypothetical protein [Dickeya dianthicola]MCI4257370.1 hypothetical protein [Dickeya dianthicola]MZG24009.1 hypothetical protein [Dickeya dianthicola]